MFTDRIQRLKMESVLVRRLGQTQHLHHARILTNDDLLIKQKEMYTVY